MKADAIQEIERLTNEARPIVRAPDYNDTGRYFIRDSDGDWRPEYAHRNLRGATLASTYDLASHAAHRMKHQHDQRPYAAYLSSEEITIHYTHPDLPDNGGAYDTVNLVIHPVFSELESLLPGRAFSQKALIAWLRATLNNHVPETTIQHFRNLTFSTEGEQASTVALSGREHVSRKIAQRVAAEAGQDVMEQFTVTAPVYDLRELRDTEAQRSPVTILVDVTTNDKGEVVFTLTAVLDTIRAAIEYAQDALHTNLKNELASAGLEELPVFLQP